MTVEPQEGSTPNESESAAEQSSEASTIELPLSAVGSVAAGDTISLKVVSVDEAGGVVNATIASEAAPEAGGSDQMAAELDQAPQ